MCTTGRGKIFRYCEKETCLLYLPVKLVDDSMFPLRKGKSIPVKISAVPNQEAIIVEELKES